METGDSEGKEAKICLKCFQPGYFLIICIALLPRLQKLSRIEKKDTTKMNLFA